MDKIYRILTKDNHLVDVDKEVYEVFYKMRGREQYSQKVFRKHVLSLNSNIPEDILFASAKTKENSVDIIVEQKFIYSRLHSAIKNLSFKDQVIIVKYYFYNLPEREIAKDLHISQQAVNLRKKKALNSLKAALKHLFF